MDTRQREWHKQATQAAKSHWNDSAVTLTAADQRQMRKCRPNALRGAHGGAASVILFVTPSRERHTWHTNLIRGRTFAPAATVALLHLLGSFATDRTHSFTCIPTVPQLIPLSLSLFPLTRSTVF